MWAPGEVVPHHKRRATVVWIFFILLILSYAAWLFVDVASKMKNPGVSITIEPERYEFPTISFCMHQGYSCEMANALQCARTLAAYIMDENGFNSSSVELDKYHGVANTSKVYGNCMDIRLSEIPEVETDRATSPPGLRLGISWLTDLYGNSTTPSTVNSVHVYLTDPALEPYGDHNQSTFIGDVPYTRIPPGELGTDLIMVNLMMEMTESKTLAKESTRTFAASSLLQKPAVFEGGLYNYTTNFTRGLVLLDVYQPALSHTIREDINPLEWAEIFGNIGGCWELLLVLWGVLFMAVRAEEPRLKGRNLKKSGYRAYQNVRSAAVDLRTVAISARAFRASSQSDRTREQDEAVPEWDVEASVRNQRAAIPGPAFNPSTYNSSSGQPPNHPPHRRQAAILRPAFNPSAGDSSAQQPPGPPQHRGQSNPPLPPRESAPSAPAIPRRRDVRSKRSFSRSFRKVSGRHDSNSSARSASSSSTPIEISLPVPRR